MPTTSTPKSESRAEKRSSSSEGLADEWTTATPTSDAFRIPTASFEVQGSNTVSNVLTPPFILLVIGLALSSERPWLTAGLGASTGLFNVLLSWFNGRLEGDGKVRRVHLLHGARVLVNAGFGMAFILWTSPAYGWLIALISSGAATLGYRGVSRWLALTSGIGSAALALHLVGCPPEEILLIVAACLATAFLMVGAVQELGIRHDELKTTMQALVDAERERNAARRKAEQASRLASVGHLAQGIAHEVNNPLAWVLSSLEFVEQYAADMEDELEDIEELRDAAKEGIDGCERIRRIVDGIRLFSQATPSAARQRLEVGELVESALRLTEPELKHRARIDLDITGTPMVLVDRGQLSQVLVHLLVNAGHSIPKGSPEEQRIRVHVRQIDRDVIIDVFDTGCGIPAENLSKIFDPFFTTKDVGQGTGLGLSVSFGIIEELGGLIEVRSKVGEGSQFRIRLPAAPESEVQGTPSRGMPPVAERGLDPLKKLWGLRTYLRPQTKEPIAEDAPATKSDDRKRLS